MQLPYIITTKTNIHYFVPGSIRVLLFPPTVVYEVLARDGSGAPAERVGCFKKKKKLELVELSFYK